MIEIKSVLSNSIQNIFIDDSEIFLNKENINYYKLLVTWKNWKSSYTFAIKIDYVEEFIKETNSTQGKNLWTNTSAIINNIFDLRIIKVT